MKTKWLLRNIVLAGTSLALLGPTVGRADPAPDLINSLMAHRLTSPKGKMTSATFAKTNHRLQAIEVWKHSRMISAGQSTVAVPIFESHSISKKNPQKTK